MLKALSGAADEAPRPATLAWARVQPVLEEILVSELLTDEERFTGRTRTKQEKGLFLKQLR